MWDKKVCVLFFNISYIVLGKYALKMTNVIDKRETQSRNSYVLQASSLFQVNSSWHDWITCLRWRADVAGHFITFTSWGWSSYFKDIRGIGKSFVNVYMWSWGETSGISLSNCYRIMCNYSVCFFGWIPLHWSWLPARCRTLYVLYIWNLRDKQMPKVKIYIHVTDKRFNYGIAR